MSVLESSWAIDSLLLARSQRRPRPFAPLASSSSCSSPFTDTTRLCFSSLLSARSLSSCAPRLSYFCVFVKDRQTDCSCRDSARNLNHPFHCTNTFTPVPPLLTHLHTYLTPTPPNAYIQRSTYEPSTPFTCLKINVNSAKAPKLKLRPQSPPAFNRTCLLNQFLPHTRSTSWP